MEKNKALFQYCLRLSDDALILGHRLSELCSKGPFLEEDLALTNISLDLIGRAQAILIYAGDVEGKNQSEDDLAYRREEREYRNHLITEQPNGDFAHVIARQLYVSTFELFFYQELEKSKDATLAAIASKTIKEIKYHFQHASDWTIRLGDGTRESHVRIQKAINDLWSYTGELFEMDELENYLLREGICVDKIPLKTRWLKKINNILSLATIIPPMDTFMQTGTRLGIHSEHLGHILSEMQYLQRTYPDAKW